MSNTANANPRNARVFTIRDIVDAVQDNASSDEESVAVILHMIQARRVKLLDGRRIRISFPERAASPFA